MALNTALEATLEMCMRDFVNNLLDTEPLRNLKTYEADMDAAVKVQLFDILMAGADGIAAMLDGLMLEEDYQAAVDEYDDLERSFNRMSAELADVVRERDALIIEVANLNDLVEIMRDEDL